MNIFEKAVDAASGRELEILMQLGRLSSDQLNGREQPCPKCSTDSSSTRFRFIEKNGSLFCSHCFKTSKADVVSSLAWLLDCQRNEAADMILKHLGISHKETKTWRSFLKEIDEVPGHAIHFHRWAEGKGVTVEAMKAAGVRMVDHGRDGVCIGFPIHGDGVKLGYSLYNSSPDAMLDLWKGKDQSGASLGYEKLKTKASKKSTKGMLGQVRLISESDVIYLMEGGTDMVAAIADGYVAVSPSNGSSMELPGWFVKLCEGKTVVIVADRDTPGEKAGKAWGQSLARVTDKIKIVELPFAQTETRGKDYRDFREEHPGKFPTLVENTDFFQPEKTADGSVAVADVEDEDDAVAFAALDLEVLYLVNSNGCVIYCNRNRKTAEISNIERLGIPSLIAICGSEALSFVKRPGEEAALKISIHRVKELIAVEMAKCDAEQTFQICGNGIWQAEDGSVAVVNGGESILFNGTAKITSEKNHINLKFIRNGGAWVDSKTLERHWEEADDANWRIDVTNEFCEFIDYWTWGHNRLPMVITGLTLATMTQAACPWLPLVSILGGSNSGKTVLVNFLASLMKNSLNLHNTTAAGIRSYLKKNKSSPFMIYDEWDRMTKYQGPVLDMMRSGTRTTGGAVSLKSDSHQNLRDDSQYKVLLWLAGIQNAIEDEADVNRAIEIRMEAPESGGRKDLRFREKGILSIVERGEYAQEIGTKMMAVAIRSLVSFQRIYETTRSIKMDDMSSRVIESLAVPASFLAAAWGQDEDAAANMMEKFREVYWKDESAISIPDYERMFEEIINSRVDLGSGNRKQLGLMLAGQADSSSSARGGYEDEIQQHGVRLVEHRGSIFLFVSGGHISRLKLFPERTRGIHQILSRIPGAIRGVQNRLCGIVCRGVLIPSGYVKDFIPDLWVGGNLSENTDGFGD